MVELNFCSEAFCLFSGILMESHNWDCSPAKKRSVSAHSRIRFLCVQKKHRGTCPHTKDTNPKQNVRDCSFVYLCICFRANKITALARKQIHKYTNRSCEVFVCSRVFVRNFDLCEIVFFSPECANAPIFLTKWPFFYLCICKFLFVAQIKVPRGKFICPTNRNLQIHK